MKKQVFFLLIGLLTVGKTAVAYDFVDVAPSGQTLYYSINSSNTVTVTNPSDIYSTNPYSGYTKPTGSLTIPSSVTYNGVTYSVSSIGDRAFTYCTGLTSVAIPSSITSIGSSAFSFCSGLTSVTIPNSVTSIGYSAFNVCSGLTSVTIPNSVTSIGNSAFYGCSGLTSITIPNSVTSIGATVFCGCSGLTSFVVENGNAIYDSRNNCNAIIETSSNKLLYGCQNTVIPNSVSSIGDGAFEYCSGLTSVTIPNSVTSIGDGAFAHCSGLTSITIPNSVTSIGNWVFFECSSLTFVTIPNNVTSIGNYSFYGCSQLTSITIPNSVNTIGNNAFTHCHSLTSIIVDSGNTVYDSRNSCNAIIHTATNTLLFGCQNTIIPNNVTSIGSSAFEHCSGLTSVTIPNSVTSIGDGAFYLCSGLDTVFLMSTEAPTLGSDAFYHNASGRVFLLSGCSYDTYYNNPSWYFYRGYLCDPIYDITVTVLSNNTACGTATIIQQRGHDIRCDSTVVVQAIANYGYHFDHWSNGITTSTASITLTGDSTLTAYFLPNSYTITGSANNTNRGTVTGSATVDYLDTVILTANANYGYHIDHWTYTNQNNSGTSTQTGGNTLTLVANKDRSATAYFNPNQYQLTVNSNNTIQGTVSGGGTYDYLSVHTITATANYGYHFTQWNDGNTNNPRTITLTQDTSFTAVFAKNVYTISVNSGNTTMGSVSGSSTSEYLDTISLTATPNYGYHFTQWNDGNTSNPRTVVVTRDSIFTAQFTYNQYSISLNTDNSIHGAVSGGGNYNYLSNCIITAIANYGYHFTQWSDDNTNTPRTITLTQDTSFTAYFEKNSYTISVESDDAVKGSATGSTTALYLDSITISATANYGYHFTHWNDGNTDNPRTVQVTGNATYTAYFDYDQFTLTVQSDNTTQGNVSGGGSYNYLSNRTITATHTYGHHFTYWNDGVTQNPRTITLTQDTTFTAHFAPNQYTLTVNAGEHGTATGSGTYNFGDTITIQAIPDDHYHFIRWNDGNTENPRQYRIEDDITLTAFFVIDTYTVSVVSSDIIRGMVEASGTEFVYGTPCTVTATAYTGYTFAGWSNGVTANPYTFAVISDVELTALFVEEGEEVYTVTVESADPTMGSVSGGGQALNGGTVIITAIPNEGYRFLTWNDGNTENPRTVTVTGNITYTAYFESTTQGIEDIDATEIKIYTTGGRIVVQGADGVEARVYDLTGREVARPNQNGETPELPSGVYLVKVGTLPARKVVVMR